jgi:mannobiose 2-epimerase
MVTQSITAGSNLPDTPSDTLYREVRYALSDHLDAEVLPFWVSARLHDQAFGGFLPHLDQDLKPTGETEGHVIVQLRSLYVHAVAVSRFQDARAKNRVRTQFQRKFTFLKQYYWDDEHGGFFNYVGNRETRRRTAKETRAQVHAINLLAEAYLLTGHEESLNIAKYLFALIHATGPDR